MMVWLPILVLWFYFDLQTLLNNLHTQWTCFFSTPFCAALGGRPGVHMNPWLTYGEPPLPSAHGRVAWQGSSGTPLYFVPLHTWQKRHVPWMGKASLCSEVSVTSPAIWRTSKGIWVHSSFFINKMRNEGYFSHIWTRMKCTNFGRAVHKQFQ